MTSSDTIYALASAPGKSGVAVVRVSGEKAGHALLALTRFEKAPEARALQLAVLRDDAGVEIDSALVVFFENPNSFTGEDVAEFHIHGGRAVTQKLSAALAALGLRMAAPGEFTKRAFINEKLDLAQAEGLADLIEAETESQRVQALKQMGGALSKFYEDFRARLLKILAHVEADIDFPDEDLPPDLLNARIGEIHDLMTDLQAHLDDARRGERLREGFSIAILGAPNAGKSSLLNALARRDAAIVSTRAGTTRDVVEVHLDLSGYPVILADTAGLRDTADAIEEEGIRRALQRAEQADLKLVLFDASSNMDAKSLSLIDEKTIPVLSKIDLDLTKAREGFINVSAQTGDGIPQLLHAITERLQGWMEQSAAPPLTRQRHREALQHAAEALHRAEIGVLARAPHELTAEELRVAAMAIGRITGRVDVEDILDKIFREFCIGK
jgi:tRNA modification GTPase